MASDPDFESSDILGGFLPVGPRRVAQNSGFSSFFKICALGASTLVLLLAFRHGRTFFLRWKERHYKLSMRRRYGIPDHDQRPFNIAYAAARLARDDTRRLQDRIRNVPTFDQPNPLGHGSTGPEEGFGLAAHPSPTPVTLQVSGLDKNAKQITQRSPFSAGIATQPSRAAVPSSHAHLDVSGFHFQPESGHEDAKDKLEAKPEGDHLVHDSGIDVDSAPAPRRSKRVADSSDDSDLRYSQENRHDKRRRKVSSRHLKKRMQKGDAVEMDDPSEVKMALGGKKRDRTEMDSSFGAEDDMLNNDQDTDFALHRHRRRRQRNSTNSSRGQKRGRDVDSLGLDTDSGDLRGRRKAFRHRPDTSDTDPSVEDGQLSRDPFCRGRRIGEEWEAHGVQFRVGPDGKRLRKVLVKEDRPKFNMPVDSEHPDRSASVTAIVERWYTEEQHTAAKEAHELAWQDSDKSFVESETSGDRSGNSFSAGKQLLWASTSNTSSPVRKIRISGHSSISSIASPRMVSFPMFPPPQYTRRVSTSLYSSSSVTPTEMSPKLRQSKSYSKWEKQEIEAEAIARLRRKAEEKEKTKAEAEAKEAEAKKVAAASTLPAVPLPKPDEKPSVAPTSGASVFSLPPPPKGDSKAAEPSNPPPLFKIPTPSSNAQSSEAKDKPEAKTATVAPANLFPFPSAPNPVTVTKTSTSIPAASGPVSSNSTIPTFFTNTAQPTTAPSPAPDTRGSATSSIFSFSQTKGQSNNPISNPLSAPQGNGPSTASQNIFSLGQNPKPPTSTENSSNPSASAVPAGGTNDTSKPKFNFGMTSKPTSVAPSNTLAAATPSGPPSKPSFGFGIPKDSSAPTVQPITNPFSNPSASSTNTAQATQTPVFGISEGKSAGTPASGMMSASSGFKLSQGTSLTNQGQSMAGATGNTTTLFRTPNAGTQAQGGATKPSSFAPSSSTTKPFFSFKAGSDTTKPEPGKGAPTFTFNAGSSSSTPAAVPPTPGSVFSNTASKSSQSADPITQPSFGAPKNAAAPSGFTFGQSSSPGSFSFGSFGSQKS